MSDSESISHRCDAGQIDAYRRSGAIEGHRQRVYARARQRVYARAARGGRYLNRAAAASRLALASVCSIGCLNYVRAARTHKTARIEAR